MFGSIVPHGRSKQCSSSYFFHTSRVFCILRSVYLSSPLLFCELLCCLSHSRGIDLKYQPYAYARLPISEGHKGVWDITGTTSLGRKSPTKVILPTNSLQTPQVPQIAQKFKSLTRGMVQGNFTADNSRRLFDALCRSLDAKVFESRVPPRPPCIPERAHTLSSSRPMSPKYLQLEKVSSH